MLIKAQNPSSVLQLIYSQSGTMRFEQDVAVDEPLLILQGSLAFTGTDVGTGFFNGISGPLFINKSATGATAFSFDPDANTVGFGTGSTLQMNQITVSVDASNHMTFFDLSDSFSLMELTGDTFSLGNNDSCMVLGYIDNTGTPQFARVKVNPVGGVLHI
jgi:hypothetical protein